MEAVQAAEAVQVVQAVEVLGGFSKAWGPVRGFRDTRYLGKELTG